MKINKQYKTKSITRGTNTGSYIMLHHTGKGSDLGLVKYLAYSGKVSCHFVVGRDGTIYQLADLHQITRHAGISYYDGLVGLNKHTIGIEVVSDGYIFTFEQKEAVRELCTHILATLGLKYDKIIRHLDVAGKNTTKDYNRGKRDIGGNFREEYETREDYQKSYKETIKLSDKDKKNLGILQKVNSRFWDKYNIEDLRETLHATNQIIRKM